MNKLLLVVFLLLGMNMAAFSQDVIVTKNSKKINAKVLEINSDNVKYKHFNNLEGPTYTLLKSEIASIIYQNGMIDVFGEKEEKEKEEEVKSVFEEDNLFIPRSGGIGQSKMKNEFYDIGTDDDRMLDYLRKYDASAYKKFVAACNQRSKGRALLGAGIGLTVIGTVAYVVGAVNYVEENIDYSTGYSSSSSDNSTYSNLLVVGVVSMVVGEVLTIVSIPVSASAGAKKAAIKEEFEQQYFSNKKYSYQPTLNFGFTQGGLGFTLNF